MCVCVCLLVCFVGISGRIRGKKIILNRLHQTSHPESKCNIVQRRCNHTFMFPLLAKTGSVPQLDFPSEPKLPRSRWRVLLWERWPALAKMPCTADYSAQRSITGINFRIWVFFPKILSFLGHLVY